MNKAILPHQAFLCVAIVFGLLLTILTPPFKVADEINHFYRAWQVSTLTFSAVKKDQRLGGTIPKSLGKFSSEFRPYIGSPYNRITPAQVWQTRLITLNPTDTVFEDFTNTALYSAFLYMPQAFGIFIGRLIGASPFWLFHFGRLSNLLIFILLVYYAIKIIPFKKWLFVLLVSLPMSISIFSSLSADVLLNALSVLLIAIVLNLSFNESIQQISYKQILAILVISVLMGLAKLVYVPILLLILLIPPKKFVNSGARIGICIAIILAGLGTAYLQKSVVDLKYIPYAQYNEVYRDQTMLNEGTDINEQIEFILENPTYTAKVFVKSFFNEFSYLTRSYIGLLGWGDISLPMWFVILAYLVIFSITAFNFENSIMPDFTLLTRCYVGLIVFSLLILIMLSQYLSWDLVGEDKVYPLQGRYFIPVFPLFFLMVSNVWKVKTRISAPNAMAKGVLAFCLFSGVLSIYSVVTKSYTLYDHHLIKWEVAYSFKENWHDTTGIENEVEYIVSGRDTLAVFNKPAKRFVSNERFFTGPHSLKLAENNPYGFTIGILKGLANDKFVVSCRSDNQRGVLVVQEFPDGLYYQSSRPFPQKDSLGWKYKEVTFILPHDIPEGIELRVFVWCPGNDSLYIDDYRITYFKHDKQIE
jgi:uncharacterized membrane protein